MSQIKTLNGVQYTLPQYNDVAWGANTGNVLTQYMAAIADVTLQLSGGSFTLTADTNFGATFGLVSTYFKSRTANIASAGQIRLANTDTIKFRNTLNDGDLSVAISSNRLTFGGSRLIIAGAAEIVNADISASAAIAYSKLALTGSIVNADVSGSAAVAYSKLNLAASIVNADIATLALISFGKMETLTAFRATATNVNGKIDITSVTATELGYLSGVTSAIQTQLGTKVANPLTANLAAGSFKLTGLAAGTTAGDSVRYEQWNPLRILQAVVKTAVSGSLTTSSTTFTATPATASITPISATSTIIVLVTGNFYCTNSGTDNYYATIMRGAAAANLGSATKGLATSQTTSRINVCLIGTDAPGVTSATSYTVYLRTVSGAASAIWGDDTPSNFIILEIGA